jgi:putative pyoverdin transport system ATP-binding/permease protein
LEAHVRLLRLLLSESLVPFGLATFASMISGVTTMAVLVLLFRILGSPANLEVETVAFFALAAAAVTSRRLAGILLRGIERKSTMRIRLNLARQVIAAPLIEVERLGVTQLVNSLTQDVGRIAAVTRSLAQMFAHISFAIACLAYLGWLSPQRLCLVLLIISIGLLVHRGLHRKALQHLRVWRRTWDDLVHTFRTLIDGAKEIRLNAVRQTHELEIFTERVAELQRSAEIHSAYFDRGEAATDILFFLALGLATFEFHGDATHRHILVAYSMAIIYLMGPLRGIVALVQNLREAEVALDRVQDLGLRLERGDRLPFVRPVADYQDGLPKVRGWNEIQLQDVVHEYQATEDGQRAFKVGPVNLTLYPGQIVFIVGGNGSGKTTLAKLITGLYAPAAGQVRLDGQAITEDNKTRYRQHFSAVFNDSFVFDRIVGPVDESCTALAARLISRLGLEQKLGITKNILSTTTSLSLGERKRVALLHAYLENRPIYLFDEWAAEQEGAFREIFYKDILRELRDDAKLVIVISHDPQYFHIADLIISLHRGVPELLPRAVVEC